MIPNYQFDGNQNYNSEQMMQYANYNNAMNSSFINQLNSLPNLNPNNMAVGQQMGIPINQEVIEAYSSGPKQRIIIPKEKINYKPEEKKEFTLNKEEELRIEVNNKETVKIVLIEGYAEIEGVSLPTTPIYISNRKFAIFCWKASKLEVYGKTEMCYLGKETPMIQYLMGYYLIQEKRNKSINDNTIGPRVMILGSKNSGKRTITHTYLNYSLKQSFKPIYVDLSIHNEIAIPGCVSATVIDEVVPNDYLMENSITFFYGNSHSGVYTSTKTFNDDLYLRQVKELSLAVEEKLTVDQKLYVNQFQTEEGSSNTSQIYYSAHEPQVFNAGTITFCEAFDGFEANHYNQIISMFKCDLIFVLDNDRLYSSLLSDFNKQISEGNMSIHKLSKSSGVIIKTKFIGCKSRHKAQDRGRE